MLNIISFLVGEVVGAQKRIYYLEDLCNTRDTNARKRHINEFMKTEFANSGRAAGTGMAYDRYDEESKP